MFQINQKPLKVMTCKYWIPVSQSGLMMVSVEMTNVPVFNFSLDASIFIDDSNILKKPCV